MAIDALKEKSQVLTETHRLCVVGSQPPPAPHVPSGPPGPLPVSNSFPTQVPCTRCLFDTLPLTPGLVNSPPLSGLSLEVSLEMRTLLWAPVLFLFKI